MKVSVKLLGAASVGFVGVVSVHGSSPTQTAGLVRTASTAASGSAAAASSGATASGSAPIVTTTTVAAAPIANGSMVGNLENYGYGQLAVKVTITNHRITDLTVSTIRALESYSFQIEQQVVPILKGEVLKAQGTQIMGITGATYTSEAYAYSIQSALDKLHFK